MVEFEKAYVYVDWPCLEALMVKINFPMLWRMTIM